MSAGSPTAVPGEPGAASAKPLLVAESTAGALTDLPIGASGHVHTVGGDRSLRYRLLELGLLPGTELAVVRRAPGGDPIEIALRGYALSLRRNEAAAVLVLPSTT